eukprot:Hpha_TRINITY_DN15835_c3_g1::TRINITY_DN15835_c3_g1_i3::g.188786::m.188786
MLVNRKLVFPRKKKPKEEACCKDCCWRWQDVFLYKAPQLVVFKDLKLAVARGVYLVGVLLYFVVYEVVVRGSYLEDVPVDPWVKVDVAGMTPPMWSSVSPYCCATSAGCFTTAFGASRGVQQCVTWDSSRSMTLESAQVLLVTTRVTVRKYSTTAWGCELNVSGSGCADWEQTSEESYYVSGAETATVRVSHSEISKEDGNFAGLSLAGAQHSAVSTLALSDILAAADVTLDAVPRGGNQTNRYLGVRMAVLLDPGTGGTSGKMIVAQLSRDAGATEGVRREVLHRWDSAAQAFYREEWERHGVRIEFVHSGRELRPSFAMLMRAFAASGVLLYISIFLIDWMLIPILPAAAIYKKYRETKTVIEPDTYAANEIKPHQYVYDATFHQLFDGPNEPAAEARPAGGGTVADAEPVAQEKDPDVQGSMENASQSDLGHIE